MDSYDLDLDQRLSEETTVLVENYTVSRFTTWLLPQTYTCSPRTLATGRACD